MALFFEVADNNGGWKTDSSLSNNFFYKEAINAAYVNCTKKLNDKWQAQAGLRLEQTNAEGYLQFTDDRFTWNNTALFPTAFVGYKLDEKNSFELNYGRRIVRPNYWELSPYMQFISQYAYDKGNPKLKPVFRNELTLKHNYNNTLFTSCSFRRINGMIGTEQEYDALSKAVYLTYKNNANRNVFVLTANFNKEFMKWWLLSADVNYYYNEFIDMLTQSMVAHSNGLQFSFTNQFTIGRGWGADTFYQYTSGDLQDRNRHSGPAHYMNCGVSKKLWKDSATLKLSIEDPLHLYRPAEYYSWNGVEASSKYKYGTQSISLGFSYNFGKRVENAQKEHVAEEAGRM